MEAFVNPGRCCPECSSRQTVRIPEPEDGRSGTGAASSRRHEVPLQSLRPLVAGACAGEAGGVGSCLPRPATA
jgi:hypothetical protein